MSLASRIQPLRKRIRRLGRRRRLRAQHRAANARYAKADELFLVVRAGSKPRFYGVVLDWLAENHPEERARFELHTLPARVGDWSRYRLHVPWLQDPVQNWSVRAFDRANRLAAECDERGIPVVNRVDRLINVSRSLAAGKLASAGLRTAAVRPLSGGDDLVPSALGLALPLLVREDWGHGGPMIRIDTEDELEAVDLRPFRRPVAIELVDAISPDGIYRKYRYVVAGDVGVRQSMHSSLGWIVRGADQSVATDEICAEEIEFLEAHEPAHDRFVAARRALGLDFLAFDYSVLGDGEIVVWEANPYPKLHLLTGRRGYRAPPTKRVFAAMTALYLERAGLPVPEGIRDSLSAGGVRAAGAAQAVPGPPGP